MIGLEGGKRPPECPRASLICEEYEQQEDSKNVVQLGGGGSCSPLLCPLFPSMCWREEELY